MTPPDSGALTPPVRRLLILSTYYAPVVGGSETHARQVATYLHQRGWQVTVLTKRVGRATPHEERIDGVRVVRVAPSGDRTAAQKWLMLPAIVWSMIRLRKTYDLVYSPDYRGIGIAGILVARVLRRPAAMGTAALGVINAANLDPALTRIGMNPRGAGARIVKSPFRGIYSAADAFPSITRAIQREAVDAGIPIERAPYLPNSVDTRRFRPAADGEPAALRQAMGWPIEPVICLFLGRLSREKGLLDLLAAWKLIHPYGALLYVVGPDMPDHSFDAGPGAREYVRQHGLESSVRFPGPTSEPERVLRAADVLVQPSHWEGAPFGVIEAMATGLPVVATRVGGMAEYLTHDVNALVVEPHDPAGLSRQLAHAIKDAVLRRRLGAAGRALAEEQFDERMVCARYETLFADLIDAAAGRARPQRDTPR